MEINSITYEKIDEDDHNDNKTSSLNESGESLTLSAIRQQKLPVNCVRCETILGHCDSFPVNDSDPEYSKYHLCSQCSKFDRLSTE